MAVQPVKILLQTTIPTTEDDWLIGLFNRLGRFFARSTMRWAARSNSRAAADNAQ